MFCSRDMCAPCGGRCGRLARRLGDPARGSGVGASGAQMSAARVSLSRSLIWLRSAAGTLRVRPNPRSRSQAEPALVASPQARGRWMDDMRQCRLHLEKPDPSLADCPQRHGVADCLSDKRARYQATACGDGFSCLLRSGSRSGEHEYLDLDVGADVMIGDERPDVAAGEDARAGMC